MKNDSLRRKYENIIIAVLVVLIGFVMSANAGEIHGMKWDDLNGNEVQDAGEPGVQGVTICGYGCTTTDVNGNYNLTGLSGGTYWINEVVPAGKVQTYPLSPCSRYFNCSIISGGHMVTLASSTDIITGINFGNANASSEIHGLKFNDTNGNGIMDPGESGVPGVEIMAYRISVSGVEQLVGLNTTNETGNYIIKNLAPGSHRVEENNYGTSQTFPAGGSPYFINLGPNEIRAGIDFGNIEVLPGWINGTKFNDSNGNGVQDAGEEGIANIVIYLNPIRGYSGRTVTTGINGEYRFDNVPVGEYNVYEQVGTGYVATTPTLFTVTVNTNAGTTVNFGNRRLMPPPPDVSIGQQLGTQGGVPTVLRPGLTALTIQKNLSSVPNVGAVNLTMNWSDGTSITAQMVQIGTTGIWNVTINQPYSWGFPSGSAQMTFKVDVLPLGNWPGPEDMIEIGDIIFIDPSGQIRSACNDNPISGVTVTLWEEFPPTLGIFVISPLESHLPDPENPQITNEDGKYNWRTVPGTYKVIAEKNGFTTNESPPVVVRDVAITDLDILLTPTEGCSGPVTSNVIASPNPVTINTGITLYATVSDTTTGGSSISSADFSIDGGSFQHMNAIDGVFDGVSESVNAYIGSFPEAGVHNICVRGTDAVGNVGSSECTLLAVYDPSAGFVTGGGWIESPVGSYRADTTLTGKANFEFVSKYQKDAKVPTGVTEFQFKIGNLKFHSNNYDWLVIAGTRAQYMGTGTINGQGEYGFMLTAIDDSIDKVRIKVWDLATGDIVYDTGNDATELGGGSIVIHKK